MSHTQRVRRAAWTTGCVLPAVLILAAMLLPGLAVRADAGDITPGQMNKITPAQREARIELGRRLFFEPHASPSGLRACSSCHDPEHGFSDPEALSADDFGITRRRSQTILDGARNPSAHWDGEFETVAALVSKRISLARRSLWASGPTAPPTLPPIVLEDSGTLDPRDPHNRLADGTVRVTKFEKARVLITPELMAFVHSRLRPPSTLTSTSQRVPRRIHTKGLYAEAFQAAFGTAGVTTERIATAIEAYCKTVEATRAPIERYLSGQEDAISESAKRGLSLFKGRAGCIECHTMREAGGKPRFTDYAFHNTGIAWAKVRREHPEQQIERLGMLLEDIRLKQVSSRIRKRAKSRLGPLQGPVQLLADRGRADRTKNPSDERHFKTPTLRDVALRPPYMHDGSLRTLEDVVNYYADGCCDEDPGLDKRLKGFEASEQDVKDLVAFLDTLTGETRAGLAPTAWDWRAASHQVRIVNGDRVPLTDVRVVVTPGGDTLPGEGAHASITLRTDEEGWITFAPLASTHARVRLEHDADPEGGLLVPDTCKETLAVMPVEGRVKIIATFPLTSEIPKTLVVHHRSSDFRRVTTDGVQPSLETHLARTGIERKTHGVEAHYEGWVRTDVDKQVLLHVPRARDKTPLRIPLVFRHGRVMRVDVKSFMR